MHRQSLGSPSSKLHSHGVSKEDTVTVMDEPLKTHRISVPPSTPHKFVHLIPILTLLCFFILYLSSHPPSPSDLDQFTRLKHRLHLDSAAEISDIGKHYIDGNRDDVLELRNSLRNLQQIRLHRKLADF